MKTPTKEQVYAAPKKIYNQYKAPVPLWAKWLRNIGIVAGAVGGTILTAPASFPSIVVAAATYLVVGGNFTALLAQSFKK